MWPALVTAAVLAWGSAIVLRLQPRGLGRQRVLYALAFGPGVAFGLLSLIVFFWRVAGFARPTTFTLVAVGVAVWALSGFVRPARRAAPADGQDAGVGAARELSPPPPTPARAWPTIYQAVAVLICAGSVAVSLAGFFAYSSRQPDGAWDAVAMWNVRARFLYAGYDFFPDALERLAPTSLPYRPLLLPGSVAGLAILAGGEDVRIGALTALAFTAGLGMLIFALVRSAASVTLAVAALALTFSARPVMQWSASQMADIPVAYLLLASAGGLASLQPRLGLPGLHPILIGLLLGMLVWVKDEGLVFATILGLIAVAIAVRERGWRGWAPIRSTVLPLLGAAAPGVVALLVIQRVWAPELSQSVLQGAWLDRLLSPDRWRMPLAEISAMGLGWIWGRETGWGWAWAFAQVSALLALWHRTPAALRVLAPLATLLVAIAACWTLTYVLTPHPQAWHIGSSLERAMVQVYPIAIVATLVALDRSRAFARGRLFPWRRPESTRHLLWPDP